MTNAAFYLTRILDRIDEIRRLTEDGDPSKGSVAFNEAKCKYMAHELTMRVEPKIETSLLSAANGITVGPMLRHIAFAVEIAERLVKRSCKRKWWKEIFWRGDGTEAFGEVLLDLHAAVDMKAMDNTNRSMSRCRSEQLGQEWNSIVLQDRSLHMCNVRLVVQHKSHLATGKRLDDADFEIAKHVMQRDYPDNVIQLGMVRIVKRIVKGITCIHWHGNKCVMKRFPSDEHAKKEAAIMKDLMHPHVVLLIGYAHHKNRLNLFSQPSPNILLEYADRGDLRDYIQNLKKDLEADVIVNVMLEIAKGMQYIHSRKIAHLDLKSMNIYVTTHEIWDLDIANFVHVKIGDFGTAIRCDHDGVIPDWVYGQGTPCWRAPELFKDAPRLPGLDLFKADVYSYAMVCVELVTRQLPLQVQFPDFPISSKVYEYISVETNRPSLPDTYPPEVLSIIRRCWDGEPSKRPSFEDIIEALTTLKRDMLLKDQFYSALPKVIFDEEEVTALMKCRKRFLERDCEEFPISFEAISSVGGMSYSWDRSSDGGISYDYDIELSASYECETSSSPFRRFRRRSSAIRFRGPSSAIRLRGASSRRRGRRQKPYPFLDQESTSDSGEYDGDDDQPVRTGTMSHLFVVQTIHPPCSAQGCEMLIQLGEDVRCKIDDFVAGGAAIGQQMYTARASHLQRVLGQFQEQLRLLYADAINLNVTLFDEVFHVLMRVEFLLASCSWPAIGVHGGPTATDEAFLSLRKNLEHCVHMMRYSLTVQPITFEEVSKFVSEDPDEESWGRACESDRHNLLQFLSDFYPSMRNRESRCHHYLGGIAVISKDATMFTEQSDIPHVVVQSMDKTLWDEGPDGLILGPLPFLRSETTYVVSYDDEYTALYHQPPVSWAVKVSSRKLAYDFIKLASLQHPHVVQMFGAWESEGSEYVAMKMMQTNVMQFLSQKQEEFLSAVLLLTILIQVAEGMSYMHSHHVRHHNLKCSNVLVGGICESSEPGARSLEVVHVEVSDYGLEPRRRVSEEERDLESSTVQFGEGDETDEYAFDVYQFALLCSELFSIRGSDSASTPEFGKLDAVSFPAKCPGNLASYLHKCGSKDPKERPKFADICTVLRNHKAYMVLGGDQGQA